VADACLVSRQRVRIRYRNRQKFAEKLYIPVPGRSDWARRQPNGLWAFNPRFLLELKVHQRATSFGFTDALSSVIWRKPVVMRR
jgi:hypothetical protein